MGNFKSKPIKEYEIKESKEDVMISPQDSKYVEEILKHKKEKDYENLVLEGGGVKGVAYCGALEVLDEKGILKKIKNYAGTSVGAIITTLLAVGYDIDELKDEIMDLDFGSFLDDKIGIIRDCYHLLHDYGVCSGKVFFDKIGELIEKKTGDKNFTFWQLKCKYNKKLVLVGTDCENSKPVYFWFGATPTMPIRDAVRISMSIPYIFQPIHHKNKDTDMIFVDGGLSDNYPIEVFDGDYPEDPYARTNLAPENSKTIGLKLITNNLKPIEFGERCLNKIDSFMSFNTALLETMMSVNERSHIHPGYWERSVKIEVPIIPITKFHISDKLKEELIKCGRIGAYRFFET
ncbi:MAG: hypothetical protein CMF62_00765 [Magnetococcales bacterium]|nr:hypothetical protein [Magnetococcales bacterium]|tara:strand:- start:4046 stop:5086 length:1041 start_codon:yes stop_codon:yes gene_type:complete